MRILFFTKSKPYTCQTLKDICERKHQVSIVCKSKVDFEGTEMQKWCFENNIRVYDNSELYDILESGELPKFDLGISNTYGRLIRKEIIEYFDGRIFNVHCAPLPQYKGMFIYNWGIFNEEDEWAVTAHYVNEKFDEGDIIEIVKFPIDKKNITVKELEQKSQKTAADLTLKIVDMYDRGETIPKIPQEGKGHYYKRVDFDELKKVTSADTAQVICKKIKACYCPPYEGAYWEHDGMRFYISKEY